ncbi:uncharacterized protein LOC110006487 [Amborella trichopoda]|uniref:Zinc finger PMZ-type domain-containing protein n=1 Tax=Amborella trichopoda TaxID=13333 RepID=W1NQ65_AMBTC|nr:uncharacterized protein LOC110006487 [Amborella trichopoda]ERM97553.1 hypothetical protein AMTR_s00200p00018850 [Amborella trichopoda]|eukprot:XP_020517723.1 uncharacterized protein LOC110006487 [Amborella trichopoda]
MAESFNAWILSTREKPIITMCKEIRIQLMIRFEEKRELGNTWSGMLVSKAQELLDMRKMKARFLHKVISAMEMLFEIHYIGKKYVVDLMRWTYSYKKWQFSGIPCAHAIAAINHMHMDTTMYRLKYFIVEYFRRAFETPFALVPDNIELTGIYNWTVLLPRTTRLPSRPKKQ